MSDDEEHNEEDGLGEYDGKKNVTIILVDVCPGMFENETKLFKVCLTAVYQIMDDMLLQAYRRNLSVGLLRDEDIVLTALNDNLVDSAKKLYGLLKTPIGDLRRQYERPQPVSLRNCLSECLKQFSNTDKINMHIVILTMDDDPHRGDLTENANAMHIALSCRELNAKLVLLPLKNGFDYELFYKELLKIANDAPDDLFKDVEQSVDYKDVNELISLLEDIVKKRVVLHRHRFRLFEDFDNPEKEVAIWVQLHYLVKEKHLYHNLKVSRVTTNKVKTEFTPESNVDPDTVVVLKHGCKKLTVDKKTRLHPTMKYGFRLLGINLQRQHSIHRQFKRSFILQSDEVSTLSEQMMFDVMWRYCSEKNRFLHCGYFVPGYKQIPNTVELMPSLFGGKPCFIGNFLPNADQLNQFPAYFLDGLEDDQDADEDDDNFCLSGLISDVIDKLKIEFNPHDWTSAKYDTKAVHIKASLLDKDADEVVDCFPTGTEVTKRLGQTLLEICELINKLDISAKPPSKKRKLN